MEPINLLIFVDEILSDNTLPMFAVDLYKYMFKCKGLLRPILTTFSSLTDAIKQDCFHVLQTL